jgi:hypothetical protein
MYMYQCMSHSCIACFLILYMCYFPNVFKYFPYFSVIFLSIISVMVSYVCPVFNICFEYSELPLMLLIACICFLYLAWNVRHVCPTYFSGQSRHFTQ